MRKISHYRVKCTAKGSNYSFCIEENRSVCRGDLPTGLGNLNTTKPFRNIVVNTFESCGTRMSQRPREVKT